MERSTIGRKPILLELRSSTWFILSTVGLGVFTDMFLYGIIIPVIPRAIVSRAGVAPDDRQKWVTILLAVEAALYLVFSPVFGIIADYTTARRVPYLVGLLLLAASVGLQTAAHSVAMYVAGRALQGASAAAVWVIGLALVVDTVDTNRVGEYFGYISWAMSFGALLGPILGGIVFEFGGYYAVFGMAFGVIGLDICGRLTMIEKKVAAKWQNTYLESDPLPVAETSQFDLGFESEPSTAKSFESSPVMESQNEKSERSKKAVIAPNLPIVDGKKKNIPIIIILLRSPRLLFTLWSSMVPMMILAAFENTLPLVVQDKFHWSSLGSGLIFIPLSLPTFLSPVMGMIADRFGARPSATTGFVLMVPPLVCLRFITHDSLDQKILLCVLLTIIGTMLTLLMAPCMAEVERVVEDKEREDPEIFRGKSPTATAYALFNMAYALGILIGPLWGGYVRDKTDFGTMGWSLSVISGATAVSTFLMVGGWIGDCKLMKRAVMEKEAGSLSPTDVRVFP